MTRVILIVLIHTFGDYFFQGEKLKRLKALKLPYLFEHVVIYIAVLLILSPFLLQITFVQALVFSLSNGLLHLFVDYFTRIYKKIYWDNDEVKYNLIVGLDVACHLICLLTTYYYLIPSGFDAPYYID